MDAFPNLKTFLLYPGLGKAAILNVKWNETFHIKAVNESFVNEVHEEDFDEDADESKNDDSKDHEDAYKE